ncbi:MAG: hypothetical protein QXT68_09060 [Halobacteria archaeon]
MRKSEQRVSDIAIAMAMGVPLPKDKIVQARKVAACYKSEWGKYVPSVTRAEDVLYCLADATDKKLEAKEKAFGQSPSGQLILEQGGLFTPTPMPTKVGGTFTPTPSPISTGSEPTDLSAEGENVVKRELAQYGFKNPIVTTGSGKWIYVSAEGSFVPVDIPAIFNSMLGWFRDADTFELSFITPSGPWCYVGAKDRLVKLNSDYVDNKIRALDYQKETFGGQTERCSSSRAT